MVGAINVKTKIIQIKLTFLKTMKLFRINRAFGRNSLKNEPG